MAKINLGRVVAQEEYELIAEYTLDTAVTEAVRTLGGNFTKIFAVMIFPEPFSTTQLTMGTRSYYWAGYMANSATMRQVVFRAQRIRSGVFIGELASSNHLPAELGSEPNKAWITSGMRTNGDVDYITKVSMYSKTAFPAGTTITIYGIRA